MGLIARKQLLQHFRKSGREGKAMDMLKVSADTLQETPSRFSGHREGFGQEIVESLARFETCAERGRLCS